MTVEERNFDRESCNSARLEILETLTEIERWFQGELYWRTSHDQTVFDKGEHFAFQRYSLIEELRRIEKDEEALDKSGLD
jgi:hypothetical protein